MLVLVWGSGALVAAGLFGLLATALQTLARWLVRGVRPAQFEAFACRWAYGMGLRMLGIVLIAVAVSVDPSVFPPLPTAFGFLGVLIPLLFSELQPVR